MVADALCANAVHSRSCDTAQNIRVSGGSGDISMPQSRRRRCGVFVPHDRRRSHDARAQPMAMVAHPYSMAPPRGLTANGFVCRSTPRAHMLGLRRTASLTHRHGLGNAGTEPISGTNLGR